MEHHGFEEAESNNKKITSSNVPPGASTPQTAGILFSLKHSSPPTHVFPEGCMNVQKFPNPLGPLYQFPQQKSPQNRFDLLSYTSGVFNNVLQINNTAIGFTGLNYFISQFGDQGNGYYLPSPAPNGVILNANNLHMNPGNPLSVSIGGNTKVAMEDMEGDGQLLSKPNGIDVTKSTNNELEWIRGNKCHICGKVYARPSTLQTHMRTHTGEKPFKCSICFKAFSQDANLTAHLRMHSGEKPFQCNVCGRRFAQSSSVTTHMRIHSGERPYKCKVCSRGFADSSTLTKHLRIHTGEKPYQCKVCDMKFSQSGNLSRHMRVHKNNSGLKGGRNTPQSPRSSLSLPQVV